MAEDANGAVRSVTDRPLRIYFWLAFGITWGVGGVALLLGDIRPGGAPALHPLHLVAAFGPSIAGIIMAASTDGWAGIRRLFARVVPRWSSVPWYFAVLIGFPALNLLAARLLVPDFLAHVPAWDRLLALLPITLFKDTGPLGEEFGWRGFALPRMLQRRRPLAAALILGVIWWAWHLPTFFIPALSQHELSMPLFFVNVLALSVIMTWLYQRTRGDLLLMIMVHLVANYCGWIGIPFNAEVGVEVAWAGLILACGGLR
jgi:membrane protease YdiL (CAAX protease family)